MGDIFNYRGLFWWGVLTLLVSGYVVAILVPYYEVYRLPETTCTLLNIVELKKTMSCSHQDSPVHPKYKCMKVTVSLDYLNQTCRRAKLFRSYYEAEETNFECSADECVRSWDITQFVSGLENEGQLRCAYHPDNPRRAYIVYDSIIPLVIPIVLVFALVVYLIIRSLNFLNESSMEKTILYLQNNDLTNVKKCFNHENVNEEVWKDGVVLSPLAVAAQCGHVDLMEYLWTIGAKLDYTEDETGKTILHFACQSFKSKPIIWCIDRYLPINALTSRNHTPLLIYVLTPNNPDLEIIQSFLRAGADVTIRDATNCTVLHRACINSSWETDTKREVISLFIKAGCLSHTGIGLLNISPLSLLLAQHEYGLCELLIEAGYNIRKDTTLPYLVQYLHNMPDKHRITLTKELENVPPLQRICRTVIRNALGSNRAQENLNLPLPTKLKQFLQLDGIVVSDTSDNSDHDT